MSTPFDAPARPASLVVPASEPQLRFVESLLAQRRWQDGPDKHVRRVAAISVVMELIDHPSKLVGEIIEFATDRGDKVNALLAHVAQSDNHGQEPYVYAPLSKKGASALIDWLMDQPQVAPSTIAAAKARAVSDDMPGEDAVPAGRYAVATDDGAINALAFYKVDRPTEGRWAGYVFVKHLVGGDEQRMSFPASKAILRKIAEAGAEQASAAYGHEIGECGICGRRLTNDDSRERGIGPVCAANMGW